VIENSGGVDFIKVMRDWKRVEITSGESGK